VAFAVLLWVLVLKIKLTREDAVLPFLCATLGTSGLAPQYLCWVVPFAVLSGRRTFIALYSLAAGGFLLLYYQLPMVNGFNIENMGAWALLKPMGGWSPSLPDARWRDVARLLGNYAIPLICLGLVVWVLAVSCFAPLT
jgi:hypothetical protein